MTTKESFPEPEQVRAGSHEASCLKGVGIFREVGMKLSQMDKFYTVVKIIFKLTFGPIVLRRSE